MTDKIAALRAIITQAEEKVSTRQDDLTASAAALAATIGPLAAAHRLAELSMEMFDLANHGRFFCPTCSAPFVTADGCDICGSRPVDSASPS
jgi:hypothetical protein